MDVRVLCVCCLEALVLQGGGKVRGTRGKGKGGQGSRSPTNGSCVCEKGGAGGGGQGRRGDAKGERGNQIWRPVNTFGPQNVVTCGGG
jgi:hypothetical protein